MFPEKVASKEKSEMAYKMAAKNCELHYYPILFSHTHIIETPAYMFLNP
jgi:hypothetical protein